MSDHPPQSKVSEADYTTIEAAITFSQRGRQFLAEYARRQRGGEMDRLIDSVGRIEQIVSSAAGPANSPTIRALVQRVGIASRRLGDLATEMRAHGVELHFVSAVEQEARAVANLLRSPDTDATEPSGSAVGAAPPPPTAAMRREAAPTTKAAAQAAAPRTTASALAAGAVPEVGEDDPRLAALSGLDQLTLAEKLALFA